MGKNGVRVLFLILIFVAGLAGCSQEGNLVVKNEGVSEFQGDVENTRVTIDPGKSYTTPVYIGKTLAFVGPSGLTVTVSGSANTKRPFSEEVEITSDETTIYRIIDDVGACDFENRHDLHINAISIKRCDSTEFGPNMLGGDRAMAPGSIKVMQIDPGCWDFLVNYGRLELIDTVTAVPIEIGDEIAIPWVPGYVYTVLASTRVR
jgi:hypothetical protein